MKIENLRTESQNGRVRVAATVTWEDCDRPVHDVFFETDEAFADSLSCNPDAFLVGSIVPAMHYGEERVFIEGEISPQLKTGLTTAMSVLRHWFYPADQRLVRIEAGVRKGLYDAVERKRAGFFFSGGIDSFSTLRTNRLNFPVEHPWSIKYGFLVYGLELDSSGAFQHVKSSLATVAEEADITLIPIYTNLYLNYREEDALTGFDFWIYRFMGSAFASIAHILVKQVSVFYLASSFDIPNLHPHSLDPLLTSNYDSSDLQIRSDGIALSRLNKTGLVSGWDLALQHLRVCNQYKQYNSGMLNCGKCEKCIRTMLELLVCGALERTNSFSLKDVSPDQVASLTLGHSTYALYAELVNPLRRLGRDDLARAIEARLYFYQKWKRMREVSKRIKEVDQKYLNSNLVTWKRRLMG